MDAIVRIAEQRIVRAMEEGAFDNLAGVGRPLDFSDDKHVPRELWAVYRVLKNAGCLPPEVEMRHEIRRLEELLPTIHDEEALRSAVREVNMKIAALNMLGERRGRLVTNDVRQHYAGALVEKLHGGGEASR